MLNGILTPLACQFAAEAATALLRNPSLPFVRGFSGALDQRKAGKGLSRRSA